MKKHDSNNIQHKVKNPRIRLSKMFIKNLLMVYEFGTKESLDEAREAFEGMQVDTEEANKIRDKDNTIYATWEDVLRAREYIQGLKGDIDGDD